MTLTNRGTVVVCPVPRNQSLVPREGPRLQALGYKAHWAHRLPLSTTA